MDDNLRPENHPKVEDFTRLQAANDTFARLVDSTAYGILDSIGALPTAQGITVPRVKKDLAIEYRRTVPLTFCFERLSDSGYFRREGGKYFPATERPEDFAAVAAELAAREP